MCHCALQAMGSVALFEQLNQGLLMQKGLPPRRHFLHVARDFYYKTPAKFQKQHPIELSIDRFSQSSSLHRLNINR